MANHSFIATQIIHKSVIPHLMPIKPPQSDMLSKQMENLQHCRQSADGCWYVPGSNNTTHREALREQALEEDDRLKLYYDNALNRVQQ